MRKPYVESKFTYKGYNCTVLFQIGGYRCGYVGIPKKHSLYNRNYNDIPVSCHGGLTYAEPILYGCTEELWWIGFDCAHSGDLKDYEAARKYFADDDAMLDTYTQWEKADKRWPVKYDTVRTLDYVENECKSIVDQLIIYDRPWNKFVRWICKFLLQILEE